MNGFEPCSERIYALVLRSHVRLGVVPLTGAVLSGDVGEAEWEELNLIRAGGTEALTEAVPRADRARYQEIVCRSALNRVEGMPFGWTLNPYRGCTHGCHYCYARRCQTQFEVASDDQFGSISVGKTNFGDVLRM